MGEGFGGVLPFDCLRKRGSRFNRFKRFKRLDGGGAAHKNREAPRSFRI